MLWCVITVQALILGISCPPPSAWVGCSPLLHFLPLLCLLGQVGQRAHDSSVQPAAQPSVQALSAERAHS